MIFHNDAPKITENTENYVTENSLYLLLNNTWFGYW